MRWRRLPARLALVNEAALRKACIGPWPLGCGPSSSPKKLGGTAFATPPYKTNLVFLSVRIMPYKNWSETAKQLRPYKPEGFTYRVSIGPNVPR